MKDISGIRGCVVGDSNGNVLEEGNADLNKESIAATGAFVGKVLGELGSELGLGNVTTASISGTDVAWVVAVRPGHIFVAECDGARSALAAENCLSTASWEQQIESPIEEAELKYLPTEPPAASPNPPPVKQRLQTQISAKVAPLASPNLPSRVVPPKPVPIAPRPIATRVPTNLQEAGDLANSEAVRADLRRALIKGQLKLAEQFASKLLDDAKARNCVADGAPLPNELLQGIAMVLAGDALAGLENLKGVESTSKSVSHIWASLIWCVRANTHANTGLDASKSLAKSALTLASQLDSEARAVSMLELATVLHHQAEYSASLEMIRSARILLARNADPQLYASCWLLEARVLGALGEREKSVSAAQRAREHRPSWPAPATFLATSALRDGSLPEAERAIQALLVAKPIATEVDRTNRTIEYVRLGALPAQVGSEFLELVESPSTVANIRRLEELSVAFPSVEHIKDALGWKLLRSGQYTEASAVFEPLAQVTNLSEDIRASVLLALGCLASVTSRHAKPGARIRAVVTAAPKNFKSTKPLPPSSAKMRVAAPIEFQGSDGAAVDPLPLASPGPGEPTEAPKNHRGMMFSGNLQLFALPDILEFLRSGQRTGTLLCSSTAGIGAIHLRRGRITGAGSPSTKGLKDYLIAIGAVSKENVQRVDQDELGERTLIGGLLVRLGIVTEGDVRLALRDQIRDAVKELMSWGVGQFAFDPEKVIETAEGDVPVELDPQDVLLNIFKEMDEHSRGGL
jgi:tetratricopeptide (TPR) repeat protein